MQPKLAKFLYPFFPRAFERRVLPIVGVCISSLHFHIFSSSHLLIFTASHLHSFSSSHLLIFTSSHLHIFSSSHLLIFTSAHLHIFTSSHLLIFTFSHLALFPSCPLLIFYFSSEGGGRGSANETARNATLSHETRFDRQKRGKIANCKVSRAQPFHTKRGSIAKN